MTRTVHTWMAKSVGVEEGVVAVPTQGPALQGSFGVCQPQLQPQPVSSAAFTSCWQEGHPQPPSFTFYIDHGVSEEHTIPCQWPWRTTADALVPAGHTKLYSSQLVSLSLWLDAWCLSFRSATGCALLSIQPTKIAQQLTVSLDFKSTAGCKVRF